MEVFLLTIALFGIAIYIARENAKAMIAKASVTDLAVKEKKFATVDELTKALDGVAKKIPDVTKFITQASVDTAIGKAPLATTVEVSILKSDIGTLRTMIDAMSITIAEFHKTLGAMSAKAEPAPVAETKPEKPVKAEEPPKMEKPPATPPDPSKAGKGKKGSKKSEGAE